MGAVDLRLRPITREGELLETVPGLIVTQHSGDGKADRQAYFISSGARDLPRPVSMPAEMVPRFARHEVSRRSATTYGGADAPLWRNRHL